MKLKTILVSILAIFALGSLAGCDVFQSTPTNDLLKASGRISAHEITIASELGGKVVEVYFNEGDDVKEGDVLFKIDDEVSQAQLKQADSAVETAKAALELVKKQAEAAHLQVDQAVEGARLQDMQARLTTWDQTQPKEFDLPTWYFQKEELIKAAQVVVTEAEKNLENQTKNLADVLKKNSESEILRAERNLVEAQAAYQVAVKLQDQAKAAPDNADLLKAAEDTHDQALKVLEVVQLDYKRVITTTAAKEILEARSKVAVAQSRLDLARDEVTRLQSGEDSLMVKTAKTAAEQADAAVLQAEAGLKQAEAALALAQLQIVKSEVKAPMSGTILVQNVKVGQLAAPGGVVMTIGQLDNVEIMVYVPESMYGRVKLGQEVSISVDSFPNRSYSGKVAMISSQAEFTPRDVQTIEGRKTTVYGVKITATNPEHELKPGMPADVNFEK